MARTISTPTSTGIVLSQGDNPVSVTSTITPASGTALYGPGDGTNSWTIDNAGLISASDTAGDGILLGGSSAVVAGVVTNQAGGTIDGGHFGLYVTGNGSVTNASDGTINSQKFGVDIHGAGIVSNASNGTISGTTIAVYVYGAGAGGNQSGIQIYNAGTLIGSDGAEEFAGGSVTNIAGGTIDGLGKYGILLSGPGTVVNAGIVNGGTYGATTYPAAVYAAINLGEGGSVVNQASGTISGYNGVYIGGGIGGVGGTLTNAGTVFATGSTASAVTFGIYKNSYRLIADPGAVFGGGIKGGGGVLELAAGNGAGSLSGIGTSITNFTSLQFDTGSPWSVSGNAAGLAAIGPITGFTAHDTIDLTDFAATSVSFASGALTLTNSTAATTVLNFPDQTSSAAFAFAPDGAGGTDIAGAPGTFNWIGSTGDWNTPSAWDLGSVPTGLDNATIAQAGTNTITISQAESIANLTLGGPNDTVSIPGGGFLQAGSITIAGTLADTGGFAASQVTDDGLLNIITDATQTLDITPLFLGGTLLVSSAFDLPGTLMLGTGETVTQTGISALITSSGNALNEVLNNGTIDAAFSGGNLTIAPQNFLNQGTIVVSNTDTLSATSGISAGMGSGTIEVSTGGVADFAGTVAAAETLAFTDATGILRLHQPAGFAATIDGFATGDTIDLAGITANAAVWSGGTLTISNAGTCVAALSLPQDYSAALFNVASVDADSLVTVTATCYAAGTRILTPRGEIAIQRLREGDLVQTISGRTQPIDWIGHRRVDFRCQQNPNRVLPVRIAAHAFGPGQPRRELLLSPDHAVFVEDVLIPVRHLINGTTVAQIERRAITYYHIELPRHDVLLADGLPAESYLEAGARDAFANAGGIIQLHPDFSPSHDRYAMLWEEQGYAPLVVTGEALERAREALARAARHYTRSPRSRGVSSRTSAPAA